MARNKYGNRKTWLDGYQFDSAREATRYVDLKYMSHAGEITDLELQPKFRCELNGIRICTYIADFRYKTADGAVIVEDVKGVRTPVYRIKKKLVKALHGVDIEEI